MTQIAKREPRRPWNDVLSYHRLKAMRFDDNTISAVVTHGSLCFCAKRAKEDGHKLRTFSGPHEQPQKDFCIGAW